MERVYHQTVKKATDDYENLRFNVAISQMMVFINDAYKAEALPMEYVAGFVKLLSPVAPHLAEELWDKLGLNKGSISYEPWPSFDEAKLVEDEVEIVVQLNGKVRTKLFIPKDATKEAMEEIAMNDEKVKEGLEGKTIRKVIAVPSKLVNIVAN